MDTGLY